MADKKPIGYIPPIITGPLVGLKCKLRDGLSGVDNIPHQAFSSAITRTAKVMTYTQTKDKVGIEFDRIIWGNIEGAVQHAYHNINGRGNNHRCMYVPTEDLMYEVDGEWMWFGNTIIRLSSNKNKKEDWNPQSGDWVMVDNLNGCLNGHIGDIYCIESISSAGWYEEDDSKSPHIDGGCFMLKNLRKPTREELLNHFKKHNIDFKWLPKEYNPGKLIMGCDPAHFGSNVNTYPVYFKVGDKTYKFDMDLGRLRKSLDKEIKKFCEDSGKNCSMDHIGAMMYGSNVDNLAQYIEKYSNQNNVKSKNSKNGKTIKLQETSGSIERGCRTTGKTVSIGGRTRTIVSRPKTNQTITY